MVVLCVYIASVHNMLTWTVLEMLGVVFLMAEKKYVGVYCDVCDGNMTVGLVSQCSGTLVNGHLVRAVTCYNMVTIQSPERSPNTCNTFMSSIKRPPR